MKKLHYDFERIQHNNKEYNDEELTRLQLENTKLKHRLAILKKARQTKCANKALIKIHFHLLGFRGGKEGIWQ